MEAECGSTARRGPAVGMVSGGHQSFLSAGKQFPEFGGSPDWMTLATSLFKASLLCCSKSHGWAGLIYLYKNIKDLALG